MRTVAKQAPPAGRRASDARVAAFARRYGDALRAADSAQAERVVDEALEVGMAPAAVQSLVIKPSMVRIGELWEARAATVADEHLATAISHGVLFRLLESLAVARARSRERVLLAAVQSQHHVLGLRMVADVLEGAGFDVMFLGADVPLESLRRFVAQHQPAVVGLSFGISGDAGHLAQAVLAVHEEAAETRIMLGGRAVPPLLREAGYPYVSSSLEVLTTVEALLAGPPQAVSPVVGLLAPGEDASEQPEEGDRDAVAERLAGVAQDSAELAREYFRQARAFKDLALRDPVTDLANRRAFDDRIHAQTAKGEKGSLLMIDVDEFKQVNDTHGHDVGDKLLRLIGDAITDTIRPRDLAARIGGDEFAVLLPGAGLETARAIGERVRVKIAARAEPVATVSIGVAPFAEDSRAALLAADGALYRAKAGGRDCVAGVPLVA